MLTRFKLRGYQPRYSLKITEFDIVNYPLKYIHQEEFEDTRVRKSKKDRQHNGQ